ncbi:hypothetical protein L1887_01276 [Cichorium endivia]|nr:hypothetical protein L1887_01276 [Cichorium endivia]
MRLIIIHPEEGDETISSSSKSSTQRRRLSHKTHIIPPLQTPILSNIRDFACLSEIKELNCCLGYRIGFYICSSGAQFLYIFEEQSSRSLFFLDESVT